MVSIYFKCPKFIRNNEKKIMLGTSDAWSMSLLSLRPSEPAYYIVDWRIFIHSISVQTIHEEIEWTKTKL